MEFRPLYLPAFGALTTVVLLLLLRAGQRLWSPAHTVRADLEQDHLAHALLQVGQVLGLFLISGSVVSGCVQGESLTHDVLWVATYGLTARLLLVLFGHLGVRVPLRARLPTEVERRSGVRTIPRTWSCASSSTRGTGAHQLRADARLLRPHLRHAPPGVRPLRAGGLGLLGQPGTRAE